MSTTTEQVQHTPGPWEARYHTDDFDSKHFILMGEARETFPSLYTNAEVVEYDHGCEPDEDSFAEAEANARLIAAAPELLEACAELYQILLNGMQDDYDEMTAALGRARAAIATAEGRAATTTPESEE